MGSKAARKEGEQEVFIKAGD